MQGQNKKILFLVIMFLVVNSAKSQCSIINPLTPAQRNYEKNRITARQDWLCDFKVIQVNFHFIQKSNGTRNFRANDDGYGGTYTGYDYAHKVIESLNADLLTNTKMHIPPGNNTPVNEKRYKFIVNGVYFHKNDAAWYDPFSYVNILKSNTNSNNLQQFDIFIISDPDANKYSSPNSIPNFHPPIGGHAANTTSSPGDKYTIVNTYSDYEYYKFNNYTDNWTSGNGYRLNLNRIFELASGQGLFQHELNHLLTLDHTVMYGSGSPCPTVTDNGVGSVDSNCNDFCWDTPSAPYMRDTLKAPRHPANVSGTPKTEWETWGSNNRMEYSGYNALTPIQLSRIHSALEGNNMLRGYLLCERVKTNLALCVFDSNITLYSGKKVTINKTCATTNQSIVNNKRYVKVVYNENESTEIFNGFEVKDGGYFEILSSCVCN